MESFMMRRLLFSLLRCVVALAVAGGLLVLAFTFHGILSDRRGAETTRELAQESRVAANGLVKLGAELAESLGLHEETARVTEWRPRVVVYGRVVPNPRAIVEVRAPFAGTLRAAPVPESDRVSAGGMLSRPEPIGENHADRAAKAWHPPHETYWPALGSRVEAGDVLAWLDIRVGPQERLDLEIKLREARAKLQGAEEVFKVQQERLRRFQTLEGPGAVSRAELDQAFVQLSEARTQRATAREAVQQWEDALAGINGQADRKATTWSQSLKAPASGEITDLVGRPGMALEAGGLVAQIVDFHRVLVRLDMPLHALAEGPPPEVELFALAEGAPALEGPTNQPEPGPWTPPLPAKLAGAAPKVEITSQLAGYWYELEWSAEREAPSAERKPGNAPRSTLRAPPPWRPGLFVKAFVKILGAQRRPGVVVPETALLYHQGRALVYVRIAPGKFERREVQVLGREAGRWILASGVAAGEAVVSRRAQVLLSEEFRSAADND
jgi:multidrug efflux pump subunit AcrA (membrane-fusion protein)